MIFVVGIGADGMAGLAPASCTELHRATVIYGSQRQLDLLDVSVSAERKEWGRPFVDGLYAVRDFDGDVHVLASGDPMLHGVGASLIRLCGPDRVTVLPHVSSVTLACARLGWSVQDTEVISLMTAHPRTIVRRGGQAIVLCRDGSEPAELATVLVEAGLGGSQMTVLEQLGGPAERLRDGTAQDWSVAPPLSVDDLNVVAVRYLPDDRLLSVLPDDAFAHDGQLTKQSMRAVTLAALAPRPGELLWDVGSGSGSIAVEWCRSGSDCAAVAFERDEQRRARIASNAMRFGANVEVRGAAPEAFAEAVLTDGGVTGVQTPAAVFIGGGLTTPGLLDSCLQRLPSGGRLVANTVTAESEVVLLQYYSKLGGQLRRFQHYRGEAVGGFTGWRPAMPVTQWSVRKP
ncbi:precorrin-6y C5,15-methyltransferase (decarboxylating) subunit CbiE [Mycolicibacterium sphagni]|uniref:Cobalamin biosynthesis bifunctional protein CbiET n=1 Tax=Mycolicibacterium sphagni TaxID=1786 RepID=A0A255D7F2_9MYCO|nr:precorrin-6y C5,15-methyltransferase (decarboxylating) subunit CbiE [Mycolicibacterium sphagni]MCV7174490.1 precorrin-6y C5,15-methyltransferase (decarboxylating) subunit CbiE [Mycolicibacterium sphagni]OYN75297.1 cobalamin biosynthesis bifunctional protein CbiET [Mycolicibacterium sphagni]